MKTTVIVPNYNGKKFLSDCFLSLQKCEPADFAVVMVDNGSTDESVDFVKQNYPKVQVIELRENTGFSGAVNAGLRSIETEYAILLNNDTKVEPSFVGSLEKAMDADQRLFSVSAKMVSMQQPELIDGTGDLYCALGWAFAVGKGKKTDVSCLKKAHVFSACAGAAIYRTKLVKQLGYFDEAHFAYLEDVDIGYRAKIYGYRNAYEPLSVCYHAGSGFSGSRYNDFKIALSSKNSIYLIYKNMPFLQIVLNLPFLLLGFAIKVLFFAVKGHGFTYLKGLLKGIRYCFTKEAQRKKTFFSMKNIVNYTIIQFQLWWNMVRRLILF